MWWRIFVAELDVLDVRERGWHGWSDDQLLEEALERDESFSLTMETSARWRCSVGVRSWASSGFGLVTFGLR
jgi:hypothetical protein